MTQAVWLKPERRRGWIAQSFIVELLEETAKRFKIRITTDRGYSVKYVSKEQIRKTGK